MPRILTGLQLGPLPALAVLNAVQVVPTGPDHNAFMRNVMAGAGHADGMVLSANFLEK